MCSEAYHYPQMMGNPQMMGTWLFVADLCWSSRTGDLPFQARSSTLPGCYNTMGRQFKCVLQELSFVQLLACHLHLNASQAFQTKPGQDKSLISLQKICSFLRLPFLVNGTNVPLLDYFYFLLPHIQSTSKFCWLNL